MNKESISPSYENIHDWEFYASDIMTEYEQCLDEGLDVEGYRDIFYAVARLPKNGIKKKFGDVLFEAVMNAPEKEDYPFDEPSDLEGIKRLRKKHSYDKKASGNIESKISGAWFGRIAGCLLGKTVEGARTDELVPFLKETGNYPMHRYIYKTDIREDMKEKYKYGFYLRCFADDIDGMPVDDDTNYTVLYQEIISRYGRNFTPEDVAGFWIEKQPKNEYCTAERVAFCNFVNGFMPPQSAVYKNPYREWIGAQIRGDYFGYINPGNPALAAEMAWRDACVSHIKNGIYGEMFVAAMLAVAAETDNIRDIIFGGLAEIPHTSRLFSEIEKLICDKDNGMSKEECFERIHDNYDEYTSHGWCHTIPNALIVTASLLYGEGDFGASVCMAVETGFDTDCNGATVGSVLGMAKGFENIGEYWISPLKDTLHTSIFGVGTVKISDRVKITLDHIKTDK